MKKISLFLFILTNFILTKANGQYCCNIYTQGSPNSQPPNIYGGSTLPNIIIPTNQNNPNASTLDSQLSQYMEQQSRLSANSLASIYNHANNYDRESLKYFKKIEDLRNNAITTFTPIGLQTSNSNQVQRQQVQITEGQSVQESLNEAKQAKLIRDNNLEIERVQNSYFKIEKPEKVKEKIINGINSPNFAEAEVKIRDALRHYETLNSSSNRVTEYQKSEIRGVLNGILNEEGLVKEYVPYYPKLENFKFKEIKGNARYQYVQNKVLIEVNKALHIVKNSYSPSSIEKAEIAIENGLKANELLSQNKYEAAYRLVLRSGVSTAYITGSGKEIYSQESASISTSNYFDLKSKADTYENFAIIDLSNNIAKQLDKNFSNEYLLLADLSLKEAELSAKTSNYQKFEIDLDKCWAVVDFLAGTVTGAVNAGANAVYGTIDALIHPADTLIALGKLAIYSPQIAPYLYNKVQETYRNFPTLSAREKGDLIGSMSLEIAGLIVPASKAARFPNLASDLARVTNKTLLDEYTLIAERIKDKPQINSLGTQNPYDSRRIRDELQGIYGKENVTSSTIPPLNKPNVKLAGQEKMVDLSNGERVRIVFDQKGFPIFDDVAKAEISIPVEEFRKVGYRTQMKLATRELNGKIENGLISKSEFTDMQLVQIKNGVFKIEDYTWHHHQDTGRMQLVLTEIHSEIRHIGWEAMNKGQ